MFTFLSTPQTLEITLGGAVVANQVQITGAFLDIVTASGEFSALTPISTQSNGVNIVTIIAAPGATITRILQELVIYNADTANVTVNISFNDNGTTRKIIKAILPTLYSIEYNSKYGWK